MPRVVALGRPRVVARIYRELRRCPVLKQLQTRVQTSGELDSF